MLRIPRRERGAARRRFLNTGTALAGSAVLAIGLMATHSIATEAPINLMLRGSDSQAQKPTALRRSQSHATPSTGLRGSVSSRHKQQVQPNGQRNFLRGSSAAGQSAAGQSTAVTAGGDTDPLVTASYAAPDQAVEETGFLDDLGSTLLYLRDNVVPVILFRGTRDAVQERNVTYSIPEAGPLRHSMMHVANAYGGLRSGQAGVGDTVSAALRGSYSARARLERANVDRARVHGAMAAFLPRVEATVTGSANGQGGVSTSSVNSTGEIVSAGVEVQLPLYTSGVNRNLLGSAKYTARASAYSFMAEEHRVALEAVTAHINLRLQRRVERILGSNVNAMQRIASIARRLFEAGDSSRTDIAIADANVESARSERDLARRTREETQADYESLTGKHAPRKLAAARLTGLLPKTREAAIEEGLRYNPTLAAVTNTAAASQHTAKAERGRFGPQVNAFGSYNRDLYRSTPSSSDSDWSVGVRLRMPLFDATMAPTVNAARHEALERGYQALDQARLVERQIERQWTAYQSARRRVAIISRQVNAIATGLEGARREFKAGFRAVTDVLDEQVKLARAQIQLETVRHEEMLAAHELAFTIASPRLAQLALARR
ncbi:MAG: TolC family protein [Pseudomonadota bacterium]